MKNTEKEAMRQQIVQQINGLSDDYITLSDEGIYKNLIQLPAFIEAETIFAFYSLGREPDTRNFLNYALQLGKTVTLPVCFKGGVMEARAISDLGELKQASFGLYEPLSSTRILPPEALDFIVVPGLAFDLEGFRVGWGGGYYDRYLPKTRGFTAGIARERLVAGKLPREAHDVPVGCIVTEEKARLL